MTQPTSRQELYDRIRRSSKDEVILEEMIRLGFWPERGAMPEDPAEEIHRRGELQRELRSLRTESARLHNVEALKKEARKRRMAESRRKRQETKERRLRERAERAEAWRARKEQEIVYLGDGVSAGLGNVACDAAKLERNGLPELGDARVIAGAIGISVGELRWLAFSRPVSRTSHYVRFKIPKRSGGERLISAPLPRLKRVQRWLLDNVLALVEPHAAAHGFRERRSIVSNAEPHVGRAVVVNVDLRDFFPTVSYPRVKGLFTSLGYSEAAATIFALLCTEPETVELELDGDRYHVATSPRFLPQGAPTSPAITNLICRGLDRRLAGVAAKLGFAYTRYADDLTFSWAPAALADPTTSASSGRPATPGANVGKLLRQVRWIVGEEGFEVHPDKTRVLRRSRRQEVTGIVVNERPAIPRETLRRFRATLYQIEKDGPEGKRWGSSSDVIASIRGFANYVAMVDREKGAELEARVAPLVEKHGVRPRPPRGAPPGGSPPPGVLAQEPNAPAEGDDKKKWWKIF